MTFSFCENRCFYYVNTIFDPHQKDWCIIRSPFCKTVGSRTKHVKSFTIHVQKSHFLCLYFSTRLKKSKVRYQSPMLGICSFPFSESPTSYPFLNSFHQTDETVMKSLLVWFSIENVIWGVGEQPSNKKNGPPKLQTSSLQKLWPRLDIPSRL